MNLFKNLVLLALLGSTICSCSLVVHDFEKKRMVSSIHELQKNLSTYTSQVGITLDVHLSFSEARIRRLLKESERGLLELESMKLNPEQSAKLKSALIATRAEADSALAKLRGTANAFRQQRKALLAQHEEAERILARFESSISELK
jgi:hypothetical protein